MAHSNENLNIPNEPIGNKSTKEFFCRRFWEQALAGADEDDSGSLKIEADEDGRTRVINQGRCA